MARWVGVAVLVGLLAGCVSSPPDNPDNVCAIFREKPGWYKSVRRAEKRWDIPSHVIMSVTHKESSYIAKARPERQQLLGFIPWKRPSSAYGYAQATDEAWLDYQRATGHRWADRDDFDDSADFIGWYLDRSARSLRISRNNAKHLYLSYHEGVAGYRSGRWKKNTWLKSAANKVSAKAARYERQLAGCKKSLRRKRFLFF